MTPSVEHDEDHRAPISVRHLCEMMCGE
jgi:hypothetical protein